MKHLIICLVVGCAEEPTVKPDSALPTERSCVNGNATTSGQTETLSLTLDCGVYNELERSVGVAEVMLFNPANGVPLHDLYVELGCKVNTLTFTTDGEIYVATEVLAKTFDVTCTY